MSEASLNRTVIPEGPRFPPDMVGRSGFELLGAAAVAALGSVADAAQEVGRRVAALLAVLTSADGADGAGLEPTAWRRAYLTHWRSVEEVWLGGGTVQRLGRDVAAAANQSLAACGADHIRVRVAAHPGLMPLVGAARSAPRSEGPVLVLDLGHSLVKRGVAMFDAGGTLALLEVLPAVAVAPAATAPADVRAFVFDLLDASLAATPSVTSAAISVAAYLRDGVLIDARSYYGPIGIDGGRGLAAVVRPRLGGGGALTVMHDGAAAGRSIATQAAAAAITLGSAIGVGFAPPPGAVHPLARTFRVVIP